MSEIPARLAPDQLEWLAAITIAAADAAKDGGVNVARIATILPGILEQMRRHKITPPA